MYRLCRFEALNEKNLTNNQDPDGVESVPALAHPMATRTRLSMENVAGGHSFHWKAEMSSPHC
jgi:hypothetical protein